MKRQNAVSPRWMLLGLVCFAAVGCGGAQGPLPENEVMNDNLKAVGSLYRTYQSLQQKPPTKVAELKTYQEMAPAAFEAVRNGSIEVVWGTKLTDLNEDSSKDSADEVLAYEKKTPSEGGAVLMKNREVRQMTVDEFKSKSKPPKG